MAQSIVRYQYLLKPLRIYAPIRCKPLVRYQYLLKLLRNYSPIIVPSETLRNIRTYFYDSKHCTIILLNFLLVLLQYLTFYQYDYSTLEYTNLIALMSYFNYQSHIRTMQFLHSLLTVRLQYLQSLLGIYEPYKFYMES